MAELVQGDGLKIRWRNPRGFEPHSVHNSCSSMVEQLLRQANDGGPIPPMDALVDAKTTNNACLAEWLWRRSQDPLEKSAQVQILQHAQSSLQKQALSAMV